MREDYELIDSGRGRKWERFGHYSLVRPCAQAVWEPRLSEKAWEEADAVFSREPESKWLFRKTLPKEWSISLKEITFKISPTDFGHLGIFPEQQASWDWIRQTLKTQQIKKHPRVLNLFAYSGGATLAAAQVVDANVCHLDASKGMVSWARENALSNRLESAPIRWIVDDVKKFLAREKKRGSLYEAIILDPPTFGRGSKGELFKIEEEIISLLADCRSLLSDTPLFILFSCHTLGFSPLVMHQLLSQAMEGMVGEIESGEMVLYSSKTNYHVPSGTFAKWVGKKI